MRTLLLLLCFSGFPYFLMYGYLLDELHLTRTFIFTIFFNIINLLLFLDLTYTRVRVQSLVKLANDGDSDVRRNVCRAFVMLLEIRIEALLPHFNQVVEVCLCEIQIDSKIKYSLFTCGCIACFRLQLLLTRTSDPEVNVALEACEFWLALAEHPVCHEVLSPYLTSLVPLLVQGMKYSENDVIILKVSCVRLSSLSTPLFLYSPLPLLAS